MKYKVGYESNVYLDIKYDVFYHCSKCNTIINFSESIVVNGNATGGVFVNQAMLKQNAIENLKDRVELLNESIKNRDYSRIKLLHRCPNCDNIEIFSKYTNMDKVYQNYKRVIKSHFGSLLCLVYLIPLASFNPPVNWMISLIMLGITCCPIFIGLIRNTLIQCKVNKIPNENLPKIYIYINKKSE